MEPPEEKKKSDSKRRMKTPSQLETLERAYAVDKYPSEGVRAELSVQLNLTDRQLQMWFCHRRLKDRKISDDAAAGASSAPATATAAAKKPKKSPASRPAAPSPPISPAEAPQVQQQQQQQPELFVGGDFHPQQLGVVIPPPKKASVKKKSQKIAPAAAAPAPVVENSAELAVIRIVEQQLGEPLREDGPVLGIEFDSLPPGAFDTPLESSDHQRMYSLDSLRQVSPAPEIQSLARAQMATSRVPREHQFIPEHPTVAQFHLERCSGAPPPKPERDVGKGKGPIVSPIIDARMPSLSLNFFSPGMPDAESDEPPPVKGYAEIERPHLPEPPVVVSKKRKSDDAKLARELEAQEKRLKKEAEKQEAARRKREEQERKELEKINRERQKELEKINRERQREEERHQREQKKEQDRLEKLAQREQQRLEKLRVKEEQRRQKEAAKLQAAYERATAKKLAKLSTGLLEDEQLELMQMGAFVQGLASEEEGGSGFDASKVQLKRYPPASVRMKRVLGVPPWDSGQNVANLVMVWRFLTTFCDALGLWSFTVDEFVQGLHDFDSRLLNEIYICLLKTLIKDVKDAAQAAASGAAGSQHAIAIAAGGHPQIVEAAYTWGFDIQEWGQHLTPLTWPEILRQFALAAGYGPRWKKRSASADSKAEFAEMSEGHNANAIATLRSGAAAVNAVALMRGKNATRVKLKKGQTPKLTPGTVKYAAFHVLSIEGGKGLTILELTDRIQKSGLRDLSSSKTPEASISAALSRDTYLFERVAPSTYCVRSPFRRDTEDPEDVLQAAIERTYLYQTRHVDPDKLDEYADDPEDDYEAEEHELVEEGDNEAEEPEQEELEANYEAAPAKAGKVIVRLKPGKPAFQEKEAQNHGECSSWPAEEKKMSDEGRAEVEEEIRVTNKPRLVECERKLENEDEMDIDESQVGEPWVQGLMEGEFADLSIEERLNALVALVDVLNEGNTIRSILESRYEAASALKRQLWEEVQVDKRRLKEELTKSGGKAEAHDDERQNYGVEGDSNAASTSAPLSDKSRAQMKAEIRLRAEKLYVIRSLPLGLDRRYNRYWQFAASADDPENARVYFESNEDGHFEVIDTEEAFDALIASLDTRGVRESSLYTVLTAIGGKTRKAMRSLAQARSAAESVKLEGSPSTSGVFGPSEGSPVEVSSAISVELGRSKSEVQNAMARYTDLDRWMWGKCLKKGKKRGLKAVKAGKARENEALVSCGSCRAFFWPTEKHCSTCHTVVDCTNEAMFDQHARECEEQVKSQGSSWQMNPSRLQLLKNVLLTVEARIPAEAFKSSWSDSRMNWCNAVRAANSAGELLHAFTELERAVDEQWLSSVYETTEKALAGCGVSKNILPWVPQTTAAVCLRLRAFDAAIAFTPEQKKQLEQALHQDVAQQHQTPVVNPRGVEETSSPDSDSPPDFQNGHARLPPRPQSKSKASSRKPAARAAAASQEQKRKRLSFRIQGRPIGGDGYHQQEQRHEQQQHMIQQQLHQHQHEQMMMEHDQKLGSGGNNEEEESSEEESESGDDREEYYDEMQQEDYQSQQHEQSLHHQDEERMKEHQQQYNNRMSYGDDEGSEEEEEYEEYEEEQNDGEQQGHHLHQQEEGMMMIDEEVEEVDEEEEDSEDDLSM